VLNCIIAKPKYHIENKKANNVYEGTPVWRGLYSLLFLGVVFQGLGCLQCPRLFYFVKPKIPQEMNKRIYKPKDKKRISLISIPISLK